MIKIEPQRSVDQRLGKGKTLEKIEDQKSEPQMTDGRGQMTDDSRKKKLECRSNADSMERGSIACQQKLDRKLSKLLI